jgi:MFS family permease
MASELFYPLLPLYMSQIGLSMFAIGSLEGLAELVAGLTKGYFGNWSDALGKRIPFIKAGYLLSAISKPLIVLSSAFGWIFVVRSADRLGKGIRTAARDAMLANESTAENKAAVFSFHRSWDTVGAILGPLFVWLSLYFKWFTIKQLFLFGLVPGLLSVAIIFLIKEPNCTVHPSGRRPGFFSYFSYWHQAGKAYKKLTIAFCLFFLFNSSDVFLILKSNTLLQNGAGLYKVLFGYILYNVVYAATSYPLGLLADKYTKHTIIAVGFFIFAVVYFGFGMVSSMYQIYALFALYGVYSAATDGAAKALISNTAPAHQQGTALGLFASVQSISLMLASVLGGAIWQYFGQQIMFFTSGGVALLVGVWFLFNAEKLFSVQKQ